MNIRPSIFVASCRLTLVLLLASPASIRAAEEPPDAALVGCWRAERVEQTLPDGSLWTDIGGCTLEIAADRIVSGCSLRSGNQPITYTYKVVEPGKYNARITAHPARPQAVGTERDYEYRVDGDRLYITSYPQTAKPAPVSPVVKVLSVSVRVGSPTDLAAGDDRDKADCQGLLVGLPVQQWLASAGRQPVLVRP